jgi:glycosyltransferase involved in cell wall biosynthesis
MGEAKSLVLPSECYETFGRVAAEAFACGTPVLASRIGAIAEIVEHGRTGLQFRPGDPTDLARVMACMQSNPDRVAEMRVHARREYEDKFTFERNYQLLMAAYERATENCRKGNPARNAPAPG